MNPCEQKDNIQHLQHDLENHQVWRKATSTQLTNIEVSLATLNERLKSKLESFDDHIKDGNAFRTGLIFTALGLITSVVFGLITYGKMEQKVEYLYEQKKSSDHSQPSASLRFSVQNPEVSR
jgi:hypothetical protein